MTAHDDALARYLAGEPVAIDETLQTLPRTANLALAVEAVLRLIDHPHWLAACGKLPAHLIRGVIAAKAGHPSHVFLQLAIPATLRANQLGPAWNRSVDALRILGDTTHPWDSAERRAELVALATPVILPAIQGVVANLPEVALELLAVLVHDGTDASIDALIPHLDLALGTRDARLERLARLLPFYVRRSSALDALFGELDSALQIRRNTSPALALASLFGTDTPSLLWFNFLVTSVQRNALTVPRVQGSVRVDSREDPWFSVEITDVAGTHDRTADRTTRFDEAQLALDELAIGRCEPAELGAWLGRAAVTLEIEWSAFQVRTNLDAKRISDWLVVGAPPRRRKRR